MKATIVVDNIEHEDMAGEWGLCVFIEYKGAKILLDAGQSSLFLENMKALGLSVEEVAFGVLSHAHYDHANGMTDFFEANQTAPFYVQDTSAENCYHKKEGQWAYIGMPEGIFEKYGDRMILSKGIQKLMEGVYLVPHSTPGLDQIGRREEMRKKIGEDWVDDDFSHEQSLVLETEKGLVIFNSCSHGGVCNIVREVRKAFPGKEVYGYIGGFHLYNKTEEEIRSVARELKEIRISYICTGHCTGAEGYQILHEELGDVCHQLRVGLEIEL